ncbi:MAG: hypothetical protein U9O82_02225 [Thermodesulfobacteriota bacterium]|nr:hypothetical protein [Thermodesulfobacteriota bacterium]
MRCPKCGFISFDHLTSCSKCGKELAETSDQLKGTSIKSHTSYFLSPVFGVESAEPEKGAAGEADVYDADDSIELDISTEEPDEDEIDLSGLEVDDEEGSEEAVGIIMPGMEEVSEEDEIPAISLNQFEDTDKSDEDASEGGVEFSLDESALEIEEQNEEPADDAVAGIAADDGESSPDVNEIDMSELVSLQDTDGPASEGPLDLGTLAAEEPPAITPLPVSDNGSAMDKDTDLDVMSLVTDETGLDLSAFNGVSAGEMESEEFEADGDDELADLADILCDVDENSAETDTLDLDSISGEEAAESETESDLAGLPDNGALELDLSLEDADEEPAGVSESDSAGESVTPLPDINELDLTIESEDKGCGNK